MGQRPPGTGRSRIAHRDRAGAWYALDNAAVIMPAVTRGADTYLFRLSAGIDEAVNLSALQRAVDRVVARFPYFNVEIRRGFFWHYLEPHEGQVSVMADTAPPCQDFAMKRQGTCLLRVKAAGRRIACEFSHVLTDGTGGLRFLKNLLAEYFRQRGLAVDAAGDPDLYDLDAPPSPGETEDAYHRHFPHGYPHPAGEAAAFRVPSALLPFGEFRVTCGILPLGPAMAKAKELGGSLTEFLTAVYLEALQSLWLATPEAKRRRWRLAVEVPVNMRKFYPTETNRNFSLFVNPEEDMRLGERSLEDLVARTRHQLRLEIDRPSMARHISRNVGGQLLLPVRVLPLFLKAPLMRFLYAFYGDNKVSGVLSNLGPVSLPPGLADHVERFDFIPAPSSTLKTRASMVSFRDFLYISFGSLGREVELERLFFSRLAALGLPVKVECNLEAT